MLKRLTKLICVFLSVILLQACFSACKKSDYNNTGTSDIQESNESDSVGTSVNTSEGSSEPGNTAGSSSSFSADSKASSLPASKSTSQSTAGSASPTPTPVTPAAVSVSVSSASSESPIIFDDPLLEQILRNYIKRPSGPCYPSDFASFCNINGYTYLDYEFITAGKTSLFNSYVEKGITVDGKPDSFAVFSKIPVKNLAMRWYVPKERNDIALTFNLSWIASSMLESFAFQNDPEDRVPAVGTPHMTFTNFSALSACTNLKSLSLCDCKGINLTQISNLRNISGLCLSNCGITSIEGIRNFSKMTYLVIGSIDITDYTPLSNNPALETIEFYKMISPIDVNVLLTIPHLKKLTLTDCPALSSTDLSKLSSKGVSVTQ